MKKIFEDLLLTLKHFNDLITSFESFQDGQQI
jgi:hypothetical protein